MRKTCLVLGLALCCFFSGSADEPVDISHLPRAVQLRIEEYKGEGDLKKVKTKRENGLTYYEVGFKERGDEKEILVTEDGRVISEKKKGEGKKEKDQELRPTEKSRGEGVRGDDLGTGAVRWNELPPAVKASIWSRRDLGVLQAVRREIIGRTPLYHAEFENGLVSFNREGKPVQREQIITGK